ncbi:MAG: PAS domain-containing protein, partial [Leptolyngbyaceae cyanobacterium MO_188.B28]|nr:PAS domain-containing protein [Leptolyngbyaceae cyanobacterium MO_188.B28]
MPQKIPLHVVLAVQFAMQVFGIVSLVGYLSYRSGRQAVESIAYQLIEETGDRIAQNLDSYLQTAHQINQSHIAALQSGGLSLADLDPLHQFLIRQLLHYPEVTTLLLGSSQGDFRVTHRVSPDEFEAGQMKQLTEAPLEAGRSDANDPSRLDLYAVDEAGNVGAYLLTLENLDVRERPWFRRAAETATSGWSDPFQIGGTNLLTINAYAPFYNHSQQLEGVFSINLSLERISNFLETLSVSESGLVFIVERDGELIANSAGEPSYTVNQPTPASPSDPSSSNQPGEIEFRRLSALESSNPVMKAVALQLEETFGSLADIQSTQELRILVEDESSSERLRHRHFLRVIPYQDDYGLDWLIMAVVPQSDFMGEIYTNVRRTVVLCALALAGSIGSGLWTSQRITRSLARLTKATQDFAAGKLDQSLKPARIEEVATLSESFNRMVTFLRQAEQLRQNYEQDLERQVTEKTTALRQSAAQLQAAQRIAHVGSWEFDAATGVSTWSDEQFRIFGRDPSQGALNYPDILNCVPPEDQAKLRSAVETAIADGVPYEVEHRITRPDDSIRYVVLRGEAVLNAAGTVIKLVGATTDITHRKRAEAELNQYRNHLENMVESRTTELTAANQRLQQEINERKQVEVALRHSEEQLRLTTDALPVLIAYVDEHQHYRFNNQAYEDWVGKPISEIYGSPIWDVFGEELYQHIQPYIETVLSGGRVSFEVEMANGDRDSRWIEADYIPHFGEFGKVKGFFALMNDISDRKAIERMKDEFISVVSHELRTPLTSLHGSLKLLAAGQLSSDSPDGKQMLQIADESTDRLVRLVNDVLDLQRIESGSVKLDLQVCDAADLMNRAAQGLQGMAQQHGVSLSITPASFFLYADADYIVQTLTNLLSNAIKFSSPGGTVWLTAEVREARGAGRAGRARGADLAKIQNLKSKIQSPYALFMVRDEGEGIPADKLESIFERFHQVDASDSRKRGGTGLGLAICEKIV